MGPKLVKVAAVGRRERKGAWPAAIFSKAQAVGSRREPGLGNRLTPLNGLGAGGGPRKGRLAESCE
ncbi:hypothetical protein AAU61_12940 [Desulfocarbo indianensis]|nr:hypothetical protein AAU61_12940 [Desulfocarbo indianensis]